MRLERRGMPGGAAANNLDRREAHYRPGTGIQERFPGFTMWRIWSYDGCMRRRCGWSKPLGRKTGARGLAKAMDKPSIRSYERGMENDECFLVDADCGGCMVVAADRYFTPHGGCDL